MVKAISMTGVLVVKMKDVAELAGVSSAAVSRYLNGGYISTDKAERIKQAIELTGYVRSSQARALTGGIPTVHYGYLTSGVEATNMLINTLDGVEGESGLKTLKLGHQLMNV